MCSGPALTQKNMRYRKECQTKINEICESLDESAKLTEYQSLLREHSPLGVFTPEFRIYHEEVRKKIEQIRKEREDAAGRGEGLFGMKNSQVK